MYPTTCVLLLLCGRPGLFRPCSELAEKARLAKSSDFSLQGELAASFAPELVSLQVGQALLPAAGLGQEPVGMGGGI